MPTKKTKEKVAQRRKNYSLDVVLSGRLARHAIDLTQEVHRNVPRQLVLDKLVALLDDKAVLAKVKKAIKAHYGNA